MHIFCVYCFGGGGVIFGIFFRAGGGAHSRKFFTGRGQGSVSHYSEHSFIYIYIYIYKNVETEIVADFKNLLTTWPS